MLVDTRLIMKNIDNSKTFKIQRIGDSLSFKNYYSSAYFLFLLLFL